MIAVSMEKQGVSCARRGTGISTAADMPPTPRLEHVLAGQERRSIKSKCVRPRNSGCSLVPFDPLPYARGLWHNTCHGERSSVGRAPDCGSGGRGFKSPRSPQPLLYGFPAGFSTVCGACGALPCAFAYILIVDELGMPQCPSLPGAITDTARLGRESQKWAILCQ